MLTKEQKLSIFAGYISNLMREPLGGKFRVSGFEDDPAVYQVEIRDCAIEDPQTKPCVWDQVFIDGEWCGNRCGGTQKLAEIFAKYF